MELFSWRDHGELSICRRIEEKIMKTLLALLLITTLVMPLSNVWQPAESQS